MLGRVFGAIAAAFVLSLTVSGCVGPSGTWQFPNFMTPPQSSYASTGYATPPSAPLSRTVSRERERASSQAREIDRLQEATSPPPAPPEASPQPTVTLAGDGADRDHALRLLDDAGACLAKVNRNKLGRDSAATYDQANDFLNAGRKAALNQDYVAATGDAKKASVLANKLSAASH